MRMLPTSRLWIWAEQTFETKHRWSADSRLLNQKRSELYVIPLLGLRNTDAHADEFSQFVFHFTTVFTLLLKSMAVMETVLRRGRLTVGSILTTCRNWRYDQMYCTKTNISRMFCSCFTQIKRTFIWHKLANTSARRSWPMEKSSECPAIWHPTNSKSVY